MADGLLNKASIILTPTGYKAGTLYNVAPIDEPYEDFDFARTSTATRINSSGLVSNVATGVPRISYDSNGDNGHILLEPTSTNLVTYSEDFSQSFYIKDSGVSVSTTNNVSPSGEFNATKIDVTDNGRIYANVTSDTYASSVFIKAGTFSYFRFLGSNVDLVEGTFSGGTIESFANGWFRISKVLTTFRPFQIQAYPDGTYSSHTTSGNYFIWGAQLEALSYATSYIPTLTGSTETRATETATGAGSADLINSTEGVLYAEIAVNNLPTFKHISLNDGSSTNRLNLFIYNSGITVNFEVGSVRQTSLSYTIPNVSDFNKVAFSYKLNEFKLFVNGVQRAIDTSGTVPTINTFNSLSFNNSTSSNFYGKCKAVAVFDEALSDSELTQLTT